MELQPKLGELVGVPVGLNRHIQEGSATIIYGDVVAVDRDSEGLDICVGFMGTNGLPIGALELKDLKDDLVWINTDVSSNLKNYDRYIWLYHSQLEKV